MSPSDFPESAPASAPASNAPPRISRRDKRRNRRRKSKHARPLFSIAHALVALGLLMTFAFAGAVADGLRSNRDLTLSGAGAQSAADLALPGAARAARRGRAGPAQYAIWIYLFGTPGVFALQRGAFWRRTSDGARYLTYANMGMWCLVITVLLVTANAPG